MSDIVITAMGAISAIGNSSKEIFQSLKEGNHGIRSIKHLDTLLASKYLAGEIPLSNEELKSISGLQGIQSRTTLIAAVALKEALQQAQLSEDELNKTGFISSTTVGGMDKSEQYYTDFKNANKLEYARVHPNGEHSDKLAKLFNINAYVSTVSTACSSASNALIIGARLIKAHQIDRMIVGGADALTKFTLNGFKSLMILDSNHCKPFDKNRQGLNLGEAAAYLMIESAESAQKRGAKILAHLTAYANVNEAYHQTASSPNGDGAFMAMSKTLEMANLKVEDIDYVNAHGTGTENNDNSESMAINRLFENTNLRFSSTKAFTGHTLAAAGGLEAVISTLCLEHDFLPGNLNFETKIEEASLTPITKNIYSKSPINHILSNSFGFGGNNSCLLFSKPKLQSDED